jgi:hypothetical protein
MFQICFESCEGPHCAESTHYVGENKREKLGLLYQSLLLSKKKKKGRMMISMGWGYWGMVQRCWSNDPNFS